MPRRLALIATSLALVVVLVGCGSDDDSSDDGDVTTTTAAEEESTTTEEETTTEAETEESTAPDESTTESTEAPDDEVTTTTAENTGDGEADFCADYTAFNDTFDQLPDETLEDIQSGSVLLRDTLVDLTEVAPEELAEDLDTLVDGAEALIVAVEAATTIEEAETAGGEAFGADEFITAADNVDSYYSERCPQANDDQADG